MTLQDPNVQIGPRLPGVPEITNIASFLPAGAAARPDAAAVVVPGKRPGEWQSTSYAELEALSNRIANGLASEGVVKGMHACVFVKPGPELIAITYALFKLGAVPVLADPGMGRERLLAAVERVAPEIFIGIPLAHAVRSVFSAAFQSVQLFVTVGMRLGWSGITLKKMIAREPGTFEIEPTASTDAAAILFTSGSTGPPKGVLYTHGMFHAQVLALKALYDFEPGEVDLACFPLFALFDIAFGMTSVFPDMDATKPAKCDPAKIARAIEESGATTSFGSPAIWRRVLPYCHDQGYKLPGLKRLLMAGAPVPPDLIQRAHAVLSMDADVFTPYGATEALPVASIAGREVAPGLLDAMKNGAGTCVGEAAPGIEIRLIKISDAPIATWSDDLVVALGEMGEVCVRGPVVTEIYAGEEEHTRAAKIHAADGSVWHRMGDIGRFDAQGRLWFLGRKSHRLQTETGNRMPVPVENIFNLHPRVYRTALVGIGPKGSETPLLVVEAIPGEYPKGETMTQGFIMQLRDIGRRVPRSADIEHFLFHEAFPVDPRHNAKIHREELKAWAERQVL
ncbi:Long-chain-fatty-acid--CoA ligase [Planctomycetes bacterium Poly30]|uniref:Long-chain-fatty-acid--CoA ligase n=1 Tax=Saltatorellus ferox TaxID=2528018 RepID=A0A518EUD3_9BACT|nr:Long-chain-fatty-acid--CoA ligase [Planctomycetes bacterium Poly30]